MPKSAPSMTRSSFRLADLAACAVLLVSLVPSLFWIWRDCSTWAWDQAWYAEVSTDLWATLTTAPDRWPGAVLQAFGSKAPGVAWVGEFFVPLGGLLGGIEHALLLSVLCFQGLALLLTYGACRRAGAAPVGALAGSLLMAVAPLCVGVSHQYFVEPMQVCAVAAFWWVAAAALAGELAVLDQVGLLALATALGMSAKATTPLYVVCPGVLILVSAWRASRLGRPCRRGLRPWTRWAFLVVGTATLGLTVAWYAGNLAPLMEFVALASNSDVALDYGHAGRLYSKLRYWLPACRAASFAGLFADVFGAVVLFALAQVLLRLRRRGSDVAPVAASAYVLPLTALAAIVLPLFVLCRQINEETRYLLPMAPAVAILCSLLFSRVPRSTAWAALVVLLVHGVWVHAIAQKLVPPLAATSRWLRPVSTDPTAQRELARVVALTSGGEVRDRINVCAVEYDWLNANVLAFYAAKQRLVTGDRSYYTSLGYAVTDLARAVARLESLSVPFVIGLDRSRMPAPNFVNLVSAPFMEYVEQDARFHPVDMPSALGVRVFRREASR